MAGSKPKCWSGRSRTSTAPAANPSHPAPVSHSRLPLGRRFGHEPRAPLADLEDVVIAARGVARIDDFVVGRKRLDADCESVAFAADAFDLNHERTLPAMWDQLACCTADCDDVSPVRNRGPLAHARSTVAAMLSGSCTAPRAWASLTSCNARRCRSNAD